MNLGKLSQENEQFLSQYKNFGYATKTEMANDAIRNLKKLKASEFRRSWREQAHKEYLEARPEFVWEKIEGDDLS